MEKFKFKITKTHYSYGYNAKHRHYRVDNDNFTANIKHVAHKGYDVIQVSKKNEYLECFISLNCFMKEFYNGNLEKYFSGLKEGESVDIEIERTL